MSSIPDSPVPTESTPDERLRPVTWSIWLAWVLVSALIPVCNTIIITAINKPITRDAQFPALMTTGLLAIIAFAVLAPPILQGHVLKRVLPKLSVWVWFFCTLVAVIVWLALIFEQQGKAPGLIKAGFQTRRELELAALTLRMAAPVNVSQILDLPWRPFLFWTIASSAAISLIPAFALGIASGRWRATWLFLAAAVAGACGSAIVEQVYQIKVNLLPFMGSGLNGQDWTRRFQALAVYAGGGAVWGAITAIFVAPMTRGVADAKMSKASFFATHRAGGLVLLTTAPLLIAYLAPFAGYLAGPRGLVAGAPELRKALSLPPPRDRSKGETVLAYSHDVAVPIARLSMAIIAPDGRSAIVRSVDHKLMQMDLATGRALRQLGDALAPSERYAITFSPDGRYLALRSNGAEVPIPNTHHSRNQARVRLYTMPDLTLAGEYSDSESDSCVDAFAREPILFSGDSKHLWLVCGQYYAPKPEDKMAIRLDVPTLQAMDIRLYGEAAESGFVGGLERIGDSVWAWQFPYGSWPFRIRDLTHDRNIVTVSIPTLQIAGMTAQNGSSQFDEKFVRLKFCGAPPGAPAGASPASWICRTLTFDTPIGTLIGSVDEDDFRFPISVAKQIRGTLSDHGLRIEALWRNDNKTGELIVRDSATGRERQRIVSIAQRPVQMSSDGRWLMTVAIDERRLRLYRLYL